MDNKKFWCAKSDPVCQRPTVNNYTFYLLDDCICENEHIKNLIGSKTENVESWTINGFNLGLGHLNIMGMLHLNVQKQDGDGLLIVMEIVLGL